MERRAFMTTMVTTLLLRAAFTRHAFAGPINADMQRWLVNLQQHCADLRTGALTPTAWQAALQTLYRTIEPGDLMRFIQFDKLVAGLDYPPDQSAIVPVRFPDIAGVPKPSGWMGKIFGNKKGTAVPPHAHNDMVSAHFIVAGRFHVRTYHRRFDLERFGQIVAQPSMDGLYGPGTLLTMSDAAHNLHWLQATSDHAFTFDVPLTHLGSGRTYVNESNRYSMIFVDADRAKPRGDGLLTMKPIGVREAIDRYGRV